MLLNYFKTAVRNFKRNPFFSLINVVGLAIGISAAMVIYLIAQYDFGFDRFEPNADKIYRIVSVMHFQNNESRNPGVPYPLPNTVKNEVSGISVTAPVYLTYGGIKVSVPVTSSEIIKLKGQEHIVYADNNYFQLIPYHWLAGSIKQSLMQPFKVVLTASRAKAYFNISNPQEAIGRVVIYNDSIRTTVTGVVEDLKERTDFTFKDFISYSTIENSGLKYDFSPQWTNINGSSQLFIKVNPVVSASAIERQLAELHNKHVKNDGLKAQYKLQPLSDLHFNTEYSNFYQRQANLKSLYGLLAVAAILLVLGCINFINLTTAQAVHRAKEIGVRKTMGSSQKQLMLQFISETLFITTIAALLSLLLTPFLFKIFADFIPPDLHFSLLQQPGIIVFTLVLIVVVGTASGFYPALVLAGFNPVTALKNQAAITRSDTRSSWLRKSLTVFQFVTAQAFIIATIIVAKQIHYVLNKDLGFKKDGIVIISTPWSSSQTTAKPQLLLHQLQQLPQVEQVVMAGSAPAQHGFSTTLMRYEDGKTPIESSIEVKYADSSYFKLYHLKLIAGRYLMPSDSLKELLINETYARFLGFKHPVDAVGKMIITQNKHLPIVGVLADFYYSSLHTTIKPLAYSAVSSYGTDLHIRLKPDADGTAWKAALNNMELAWKKVYPDTDFSYYFLDDSVARFYQSEQNMSRLLNWATGLAIFISCLGLLGLVIHTTSQRTKEIGVRKVLGASVAHIIVLLSSDFLKLVLTAILIASPLAWYAMSGWLQGFAYRTTVPWWLFVAAGGIAVGLTLLTIAFNAVKAAVANPVKSLRSE
ncbi:FtsX-like permease family protein [Mucilaginibacter robiniae]|uniref:FtsX-like permease family protein n=1 Tax=Mucilaginibacter robiniae TaxID=2728022 RepID=A0A7L5E8K5_9SPHI|nr:ABC transporter permease [Mucilaginibacter robiniae]QJD98184.1 FtsX-like permease family protein [Mucilaginibacter robiniae]